MSDHDWSTGRILNWSVFEAHDYDRWKTTNPDERFDVSEDELLHFTCMEPDRREED